MVSLLAVLLLPLWTLATLMVLEIAFEAITVLGNGDAMKERPYLTTICLVAVILGTLWALAAIVGAHSRMSASDDAADEREYERPRYERGRDVPVRG